MTHNQIDFARLKEERRHNVAGEGETGRHNRASEAIGATSASAAVSQASAAHRMASETARHNIETENINWYSAQNLAYLQGAQAYNQYNMGMKAGSEVGVQAGQLSESERHNRATEAEIGRHNVTSETETQRHNLATEDIQQQNADTAKKEASTHRGQAITGGIKDVTTSVKSVFGIVKSGK